MALWKKKKIILLQNGLKGLKRECDLMNIRLTERLPIEMWLANSHVINRIRDPGPA